MADPGTSSKHLVAQAGEIPPGASRLVSVEGKEVALFNVEGHLYAISNRCAHRSGPLVKGHVEVDAPTPEGPTTLAVRCSLHGWMFELSSGRCLTRPSASLPSYVVTVEDGQVFLTPAHS